MAANYTTNTLASGDVLSYMVQQNDVYMSANVDVYTVVAAINHPTTAPRFRLFVLHDDETIDYEIPDEDIVLGGSYSVNYQDGQRRSLSFSLINELDNIFGM